MYSWSIPVSLWIVINARLLYPRSFPESPEVQNSLNSICVLNKDQISWSVTLYFILNHYLYPWSVQDSLISIFILDQYIHPWSVLVSLINTFIIDQYPHHWSIPFSFVNVGILAQFLNLWSKTWILDLQAFRITYVVALLIESVKPIFFNQTI